MPEVLREEPVPGPFPRFELPRWREQYRVTAGITGRGFDLGLWGREPVGDVMARWRTFRRAEPGFHAVVLGHQVHATSVAFAGEAQGWVIRDGVDGHTTDRPGTLLTVTVADCIPVYLLDPARRAAALLHAGWRGIAGGILAEGVAALERLGGARADFVMHCGVGICGSCYEVGPEVITACGGVAGEGRGPLDLRAVLARQGQALGLEWISTSPRCSAHEPEDFWSHRASGGAAGRMVAYLGLLP
jgi:polyphenol oxidase